MSKAIKELVTVLPKDFVEGIHDRGLCIQVDNKGLDDNSCYILSLMEYVVGLHSRVLELEEKLKDD